MREHKLTVTMSKRETDFINNCMNNNQMQNDEQYDWKFMFDDGSILHIVISGQNNWDAKTIREIGAELEYPGVFLALVGEDWEEDMDETMYNFWGQYCFTHDDNYYTFTVNPSKSEVQ